MAKKNQEKELRKKSKKAVNTGNNSRYATSGNGGRIPANVQPTLKERRDKKTITVLAWLLGASILLGIGGTVAACTVNKQPEREVETTYEEESTLGTQGGNNQGNPGAETERGEDTTEAGGTETDSDTTSEETETRQPSKDDFVLESTSAQTEEFAVTEDMILLINQTDRKGSVTLEGAKGYVLTTGDKTMTVLLANREKTGLPVLFELSGDKTEIYGSAEEMGNYFEDDDKEAEIEAGLKNATGIANEGTQVFARAYKSTADNGVDTYVNGVVVVFDFDKNGDVKSAAIGTTMEGGAYLKDLTTQKKLIEELSNNRPVNEEETTHQR